MFRFVVLSVVVVAFNSFAADAELCERSVNNVFNLMYSSPKDQEKLKLDGVKDMKKKEIARCIAKTAPAVAECQANAKSFAEVGKCPKK